MRYLLILSVFLAGCASAPGINKSFLTGASDSTGKIIFSFTKTGRYGNILSGKLRLSCIPDVDGEIADGRSFVKYIDGGSPGIPISADLNITSQRPLGIVHLLELPEGDCKLFAYSGLAHGMASTTTANAFKPFTIRFKVTAGKTVYIGNFNTQWSQVAASYAFSDMYDRDIEAINVQSPGLLGSHIEKQIATLETR